MSTGVLVTSSASVHGQILHEAAESIKAICTF